MITFTLGSLAMLDHVDAIFTNNDSITLSWKNRITESKAIQGLMTFTGTHDEFKEWCEKLLNQFNIVYKG